MKISILNSHQLPFFYPPLSLPLSSPNNRLRDATFTIPFWRIPRLFFSALPRPDRPYALQPTSSSSTHCALSFCSSTIKLLKHQHHYLLPRWPCPQRTLLSRT